MKLLVDAVGVRPGSAAIVIANVLAGWRRAAPGDSIRLLVDGTAQFAVPDDVEVVALTPEAASGARRLWAQTVGVRGQARRWPADAVLSAVTAGALGGAPAPVGAIVYDLRHELRPAQFSRARRVSRRLLYGWSFRHADALFCISERTRDDLLSTRPGLAAKAHATPLGADHATGWKPDPGARDRYVLAFGHFANKNVEAVVRGWARFDGDPAIRLRICGLGAAARARLEELIGQLGVAGRVELLPWLSDEEFQAVFAGAGVVLYPSDFEGFGLPALEAMLLRIPVVISAEPALLELTAGHALEVADTAPATLAAAIGAALTRSPEQIAAAAAHARAYTWVRTAAQMRAVLAGRAEAG